MKIVIDRKMGMEADLRESVLPLRLQRFPSAQEKESEGSVQGKQNVSGPLLSLFWRAAPSDLVHRLLRFHNNFQIREKCFF